MTREEFFEWLETCPTHKWEVTHEEYNHVVVSFKAISIKKFHDVFAEHQPVKGEEE